MVEIKNLVPETWEWGSCNCCVVEIKNLVHESWFFQKRKRVICDLQIPSTKGFFPSWLSVLSVHLGVWRGESWREE